MEGEIEPPVCDKVNTIPKGCILQHRHGRVA